MALADKIREATKQHKGTFMCKLMQVTLDPKLSQDDVDAVIAVINSNPLNENHIPNNKLSIVLREEGFDISASAVDRHRRGDCSCGRMLQGDK